MAYMIYTQVEIIQFTHIKSIAKVMQSHFPVSSPASRLHNQVFFFFGTNVQRKKLLHHDGLASSPGPSLGEGRGG